MAGDQIGTRRQGAHSPSEPLDRQETPTVTLLTVAKSGSTKCPPVGEWIKDKASGTLLAQEQMGTLATTRQDLEMMLLSEVEATQRGRH